MAKIMAFSRKSGDTTQGEHRLAWIALTLTPTAAVSLGLVLAVASGSLASSNKGWPAYGGSPESIRYSALDQIDRANVRQLQVAWTYDSKETGGLQTNPIVVEGLL